MSVQSKFYQVTGQILLEYKSDQYNILRNSTGNNFVDLMVYKGVDDNQYCMITNNVSSGITNNVSSGITNNVSSGLYLSNDKFTQYYGGINASIDVANNTTNSPYGHDIYVTNSDFQIGTLIEDVNGEEIRNEQIYYDTIRLYILTGYVMNGIGGYSVKVKGKITKVLETNENDDSLVKLIDDYMYLLNWYMPKEELKNHVTWLENPLYLNSKFYDRYIEIKLPSGLDIALNNRNIDYVYEYVDDENETHYLRGKIDPYANLIVEFATVQLTNIELEDKYNALGPSSFILDDAKQISLYPYSNANNISVKLYEDPTTHSIVYYPTYGDGAQTEAIDLNIMTLINTGQIPLINYAELDSANDGMDDFLATYGAGSVEEIPFKWIVINELSVTYIYNGIFHIDSANTTKVSYTDYFTNTIDYSFKTVDDGQFYISKFVPYIKERVNMRCCSIFVQYNCHLYNRMNNTDIVRSASMTITKPYKYILTSINTGNVNTYKIVNKIEKPQIIVGQQNVESAKPKIIKEFYDVTELVASPDGANIYNQGRMVLRLNHSGTNSKIKLYTLNKDNIRVPYDLSGPWKYKLVFPTTTGNYILIFHSVDNENTNLQNGSLSFYISGDNASAIMNVPTSERYFSLMIDNGEQDNSVIYEGRVEWKV